MHKQRLWVLPKPHCLLMAASSRRDTVTMQCQLNSPNLSFLMDHQVMSRALFPAAGMLEAAAAAAKTMLHDQQPDSTACMVSDLTITAPIVLTGAKARAGAVMLQISINAATGSLELAFTAADSSQLHHSARGHVATASRPAAVQQQQGGCRAAVQLVAGLMDNQADAAEAAGEVGDEHIWRRRAGPRAGKGAEAGAAACSASDARDAVAEVSHFNLLPQPR